MNRLCTFTHPEPGNPGNPQSSFGEAIESPIRCLETSPIRHVHRTFDGGGQAFVKFHLSQNIG